MSRGLLDRALRELGELQEHVGADAFDGDGFAAYRMAGGRERFAREILGATGILRWQREAWAALEAGATQVAVRSANACGKTWWNMATSLYEACVNDAVVVYQSATARQNRQQGSRELKKLLVRAPAITGDLFLYGFIAAGNGRIFFQSGDDASALQGTHDLRVVCILDEFGGGEPEQLEAAFANVSGGDSALIVSGNPTVFGSAFHAIFLKSAPGWWKRRVAASEVLADPAYDLIPGLVTRGWINQMRWQYGEESQVFQSRCEGNFPATPDDAHFPTAAIESAFARWEDPVFRAVEWQRRRTLGVDVAASSEGDESIICVARGGYVERFIAFREPDTMKSVGRVIAAFRELGVPPVPGAGPSFGDPLQYLAKPVTIMVDEIGVGKGAVDRLKEAGFPAQGFNASRRCDDEAAAIRFTNQRAESYDRLRTLLVKGRVALPRDLLLEEELRTCRSFTNSSGRLQVIAKADWRTVIDRSPDRLDALVMACAASAVPTFDGPFVGPVAGI